MDKIFCPNCNQEESFKIVERNETLNVKGENITIKSKISVCDKCGNEIFNEKIEDENLELAYIQYRKNHKLLSLSEIRNIREKYGMSQRLLGRLLDWGEVTINRYENGAIQDSAHNEVLMFISKPENMLILFEKNADLLSQNEKESVRKQIETSIKNEKRDMLEQCWYLFDDSIDEFSGYKKFDLQKMKDMISCIVQKSGTIFKTKLNKLLWYIDFLFFKEFSVSISGGHYIHLPYGPILNDYDLIIDTMITRGILEKDEVFFNEEISGEELKISSSFQDIMHLTKYELKVIDFVVDYFKNKNSKEISEISHQEGPYKKTNPGDKISYELASELSLSMPDK